MHAWIHFGDKLCAQLHSLSCGDVCRKHFEHSVHLVSVLVDHSWHQLHVDFGLRTAFLSVSCHWSGCDRRLQLSHWIIVHRAQLPLEPDDWDSVLQRRLQHLQLHIA